jgi:heme/copper-type cytochrome/quinol oxidase subunit 4
MYQEPEEDEEIDEPQMSSVSQSEPEVKYRIGLVVAIILGTIAISLDIALAVADYFTAEIAGEVIDIVQFIFFQAVFIILGAPVWKGSKRTKKIWTVFICFCVGLIPLVNDWTPEIFIDVIMVIYYTRQEDRDRTKRAFMNNAITRFKNIRTRIRR